MPDAQTLLIGVGADLLGHADAERDLARRDVARARLHDLADHGVVDLARARRPRAGAPRRRPRRRAARPCASASAPPRRPNGVRAEERMTVVGHGGRVSPERRQAPRAARVMHVTSGEQAAVRPPNLRLVDACRRVLVLALADSLHNQCNSPSTARCPTCWNRSPAGCERRSSSGVTKNSTTERKRGSYSTSSTAPIRAPSGAWPSRRSWPRSGPRTPFPKTSWHTPIRCSCARSRTWRCASCPGARRAS